MVKRDADKNIKRAKRFINWFVIAFAVGEVVILTLKGIIYLSDRDWLLEHNLGSLKIVFFILHVLRIVFPITLIVKLVLEVR